jgi:hypothetical protein
MNHIKEFKNLKKNNLLETEILLKENNLVVHNAISKIILMGSRGLQGGYQPDSDVDLGLILHKGYEPNEQLCNEALELTLSYWIGDIELDTAIVFDKLNCGLLCYQRQDYSSEICSHGKDCIGLYKIQKGFSGFVPEIGLEVKYIFPMLIIWEAE